MDKYIATADLAQQNPVSGIVKKTGLVPGSVVVASKEVAQGKVQDDGTAPKNQLTNQPPTQPMTPGPLPG